MTTTISPSTNKPLDYDWLDRDFSKTKAKLFMKRGAGFLGSLLCNHRFAWDEEAPTAWCNGETIAFNPRFYLEELTPETRITVLAHELWHTGCDHMGRLGNRCPDLWNIAGDHFINLMLEEHGFSFQGIEWVCKDPQYKDMSTEQIYELLVKNGKQGSTPQSGKSGTGGTDKMSGDIRPLPKGTNKTDVIRKIVQATQSSKMAKEAGVIPGEVTEHIDSFLNPVLPWDVLLVKYFTELSKDDYSWKRPSRRYETEYLPTLSGKNGLEHLIFYFDVSGSLSSSQLLRMTSEVAHIHQTFRPKKLTIVTFDTKIHDIFEFTDDEVFTELEIHGRGGTSLDPVYHHIKKHRPTAAIVFSDLYCYPMQTDPRTNVLWVVMDNPKAQTFFGKTIHLDKRHM